MTRPIALLISLLMLVATPRLRAAVGDWNYFPAFATPVGDVAVGDDAVYFVAGGNLFSYDPTGEETRTYSLADRLNGTDISSIHYNHYAHYLLVAYVSGNIDILYDGGDRTVAMPDIAESNIAGNKGITDVAFAPGRAYIATEFGLIEYDDQRHEVVQSGIYNTTVQQVEVIGDRVLIFIPYTVRTIPRGERFNTLDKFTDLQGTGVVTNLYALSDSTVLIRRFDNADYHMYVYGYDPDFTQIVTRQRVGQFTTSSALMRNGRGGVWFVADSVLYSLDAVGIHQAVGRVPADIVADNLAAGASIADIWALNRTGITDYDLSQQQPVVKVQRFKPATFPVTSVAFMDVDPSGERIYARNLGPTVYRAAGDGEGGDTPQQTAVIGADGSFADVAAAGYQARNSWAAGRQKALGVDQPIAPSAFAHHPTDPDTYYLGTGNDGLLRVTSGKVTGVYDESNSNMTTAWGCRVMAVAFDPDGNLWVSHMVGGSNPEATTLVVLPASKVALDPSEVTAADWLSVDHGEFTPGKDARVFISKRSGMVFVYGQSADRGLMAISTGGTWGRMSDDKALLWTSFTDQDGKQFAPTRFSSICEDSRGRIWIGSDMGIFELANPAAATDPSMTVNRLKVPRNDGTNSADYLLDADLIYCIAEDHARRKWIATDASGIYLVSENGQQIIDHFTSENSILPTNTVHSVCASPTSNTVWIGTSFGLFSYEGASSPSRPDYDDVLVYPNPVRPEYSGNVTITGLMDGTLLKIADASGAVVAQLQSEGGMAVWNCENQAGRRVPTGVYYVMLSSGTGLDGSSTSGAVAKFMIVN